MAENGTKPLTCGTCRYVGKQEARDLSGRAVVGQSLTVCRYGPPVPLLVAPGQLSTVFPMVTDQTPACGRYRPCET